MVSKTKTTKAKELINADVNFISICKAKADKSPGGANKLGFKILKTEDGNMKLDFKSVFKKDQPAFVASIIVNKGADLNAAVERIKKAGFSVDSKTEEDGLTIFKQHDVAEEEGQYVLKVDEAMAMHVVTKGFSSYDFQETSFAALFSQEGVLPMISAAGQVLQDALFNILFGSEITDPQEAADAAKKTIKEYSNVVTAMISAIPVTAFKMDTVLNSEESTVEKTDDTTTVTDPSTVQKDDNMTTTTTAAPATAVTKTDGAPAGTVTPVAPVTPVTPPVTTDPTTTQKTDDAEPTLAQVLKAVTDLTATVQKVSEKQDSQETHLAAVEKIAKAADEAVNGTTVADAPGDKTVTQKADTPAVAWVQDSAYRR